MARPGIMLYFDILEPIRVLPDAEKGQLLVAMLEYGQSGTVPEFTGMLALAWGFVKPKLDRDDESYEEAKVQRKYAAFCKKRNSLNLPKIPFEVWLSMDNNERKRMVSEDNEPLRAVDSVASRYPTTTTTAAASTSTSATTSATAAATDLQAATGDASVVFLSSDQIADLQAKMGIQTFDYYVDKLSNFIIKNGASVKNHYETILKWWQEDGKVKPTRRKHVPKGASGQLGSAELENIRRLMAEG